VGILRKFLLEASLNETKICMPRKQSLSSKCFEIFLFSPISFEFTDDISLIQKMRVRRFLCSFFSFSLNFEMILMRFEASKTSVLIGIKRFAVFRFVFFSVIDGKPCVLARRSDRILRRPQPFARRSKDGCIS